MRGPDDSRLAAGSAPVGPDDGGLTEPVYRPVRVRRTASRARTVLGLVAVALALAWALVGFRVEAAHEYAEGIRGYPIVAGGDHLYYTAMMLQYGGDGFDASLQESARRMDYPLPWQRLGVGFLDPTVAPLVYARPVLPLTAALFRPLVGTDAIMVPGILAALAMPALLYVASRRMQASRWVAVPIVLLLATRIFDEHGTGIYTEALLGLFLVGAAATLPWDRRRPSVADVTWLGFFIAAGSLTRQLAPAFAGLAVGGLLWGLAFGPDRSSWVRAWRLPAAVSVVFGAVATVAVQAWAPYDVVGWTAANTVASSRAEGLIRAVRRIPSVFGHDFGLMTVGDLVTLLPLLVLGLASLVVAFRHPVTGAFLGAAAPMVLTVGLNGTGAFRYTEPALVLLVLVMAVAMNRLWPAPAPRPGPEGCADAEPVPSRAGGRMPVTVAVWTAVPVAMTLLLLSAVAAVYHPSQAVPVGRLTAEQMGRQWTLTVPSIDITCGGDNAQVWGTTPDGQAMAVTGTAKARSLGVPSITRFSRQGALGPVSPIAVVRAAVALCRSNVPPP